MNAFVDCEMRTLRVLRQLELRPVGVETVPSRGCGPCHALPEFGSRIRDYQPWRNSDVDPGLPKLLFHIYEHHVAVERNLAVRCHSQQDMANFCNSC